LASQPVLSSQVRLPPATQFQNTFLTRQLGFAFSTSYLGLPAIALASPSIRVQQWLKIYDLGKLVAPTVAATSSVIWAHITYESYRALPGSSQWLYYSCAGLATFLVLPWTALAIGPTNQALIKIAAEKKDDKELVAAGQVSKVEEHLSRWDWTNYVRASLPMVGAFVGIWGMLN
jgi:hypothetical protein